MNEFILLLLSTALVNNVVLIKFLGLCPVMGVSKSVDSALGMGLATTFVITLAAGASWMLDNWLLAPFGLGYLRILTFILVIAAVVQFTEMFIRKARPALYQSLGIYLPLITTNCAVLGVALLNVEQKLSLFKSLLYGFGSALGFTLVLLVFAGLRERVALARVPAAFAGAPISFITISLMPGSNCGQCGFAGCSAAATAIAEGVASPACCPPGGKALAVVIAVRLGITVDLSSDFVGDGWGVHPADHKRPAADSPAPRCRCRSACT
ncbi:electron transport complex subunit RsxA [Candidatus Accumulibacter aalborgensis]